MKTIVSLTLLVFIMLFSFYAYSRDWTAVANTDRGIIYIDEKSISKKSGYVYYTTLNDNKKPHEGALSLVLENKADCSLLKFKPYIMKFYEGSMGRGKLLGKVTDGEWIDAASPPFSKMGMGYAFRLVCKHMK